MGALRHKIEILQRKATAVEELRNINAELKAEIVKYKAVGIEIETPTQPTD